MTKKVERCIFVYVEQRKSANFFIIRKEEQKMKITLDLDTCEITVPTNFFVNIQKQNELIAAHDGTPVPPMEVIKNAFNTAMKDTDKYVHVKAKK